MIFDLDGTLSDSSLGIVNCFNHALKEHDFPEKPSAEIVQLIGKGMLECFELLTGIKDEGLFMAMIETYRARYADTGFRENTLYGNIPQMLEALKYKSGAVLGICTTKKRPDTERILAMFGIADYFSFVSCGDIGIEKTGQLEELLRDNVIDHNALMIGDRRIDLHAARMNGLHGGGVLWGFGSREELEIERPQHLFDSPAEILDLY